MSVKTQSLEERLAAHPELNQHLLTLLELAEGSIDNADHVEELTVEGIKTFGQQVMQDWAQEKEKEKSQALRNEAKAASPNGKKN